VFGFILAFVFTLMLGYVFWRAASVPLVRRRISRKRLIGIGLALWASFFLGRVLGPGDIGSLAKPLELWSMTWLATLFLMSAALLVADAATGFGFFLTRFEPTLRSAALVAGAALSAVALAQGLRSPVVQSYDVYPAGLPAALDGTVIVALSDLHLGPILGETWLAARVEQAQAERPDVVVLLGDIFEGHSAPGAGLLAALRRLSAPKGIWGVLGNHESHSANNDNTAMFEQAGVHLLRNTWVELRPGLVLAGVDNLSASRDAGAAEASLATALAGRPLGATVLLSHAPLYADLAAGKGVNLMLSGHTHGGQIWPFGYFVRQRFPLLDGRHEIGAMTLVVSHGTGTWGPRMRLWRPAEILRVTLHARAETRIPAANAASAR
jgi:predicted MPP superfamily phosphohydrolase